ncbi:hypothetical protein [Roseateles sp.]|jgi:hypothetical protein|uniref:hypothetical protein n=1 Tax=Roseateles sp. TaxID=1971397 RepID=UPI0037CAAF91
MKRALIPLGLLVFLTGCAQHYAPGAVADPYGFFSGLWHGLVSPYAVAINLLSWVLSLMGLDLLSSIQIIGKPNTGFGYWCGFLMGLASYSGAAISR